MTDMYAQVEKRIRQSYRSETFCLLLSFLGGCGFIFGYRVCFSLFFHCVCFHIVSRSHAIPSPPSVCCAPPHQSSDESRYKTLFTALDMSQDFYFSHSFDLTNTVQHHVTHAPPRPTGKVIDGQPLYNDMFLWNFYHMQPLAMRLGEAAAKWVVPLVHGFFSQTSAFAFGGLSHCQSVVSVSRTD